MVTIADVFLILVSLVIIGVPAWYIWKWNFQKYRGKEDIDVDNRDT